MATVPSERTWTAGEVATAAMFNANLRDAVNFCITNRPRALLRQTVAQSLTSGVTTSLTFDVEDLDNDGGHSTVTNTSRYTAQTAGWFWVYGIASFSASSTNGRTAALAVNGTALNGSATRLQASASSNTAISTGRMVFLNVGDYVELQAMQDSGGALNTSVSGSAQSSLSIWWLGT